MDVSPPELRHDHLSLYPPGHLLISRLEVHTLSCVTQVRKGQLLVGRSPGSLRLPLCPSSSVPANTDAMLPRPSREEGHPAWPGSCPLSACRLLSTCQVPA